MGLVRKATLLIVFGMVTLLFADVGNILKSKGSVEVLRAVEDNASQFITLEVKLPSEKEIEESKKLLVLPAIIEAEKNLKNSDKNITKQSEEFLKRQGYFQAKDLLSLADGFALQEKDKISTESNSSARLEFADKTVVNLGPNTQFEISQYLYDENNASRNRSSFTVPTGIFNAITGGIGKVSPDRFKLKMRTATIGVRGTEFIGAVQGNVEKLACTSGEIFVASNGVSVDVPAGQITSVLGGAAPSAPVALTALELTSLLGMLSLDADEAPEVVPVVDANENNETNVSATEPITKAPVKEDKPLKKIFKYWE